ncbi:MAG TPA: tetratricopeptide repeat protein [Stellaceae bacterium]|nr:tetratricopeptide repeat protein [Stellaceae bacterium]
MASYRQGNLAHARSVLESLLSIEPDHFDALHLLGVIAFQTRNPARAVDLIDRALKIAPDSAAAYNNRGSPLKELGRYDEALASYDRAIALKPDYAIAHFNRGNTLKDLQRFEEALASYDRAIAIVPGYADAHYNRANVLSRLKRFEEAVGSYAKAIAIKPDHPDAHNNRGSALRELKRYPEALASHEEAIARNPDFSEAWLGRGTVLCDLRRYDDALASYDRAIAIKPELAGAWHGRGNVLYDLGRYDDALASLDRATAIDPELAAAWLARGDVLCELWRCDEALASFDRAIALDPDFAEAWIGRGNAFNNLKRFEEAIAAYDKAMALKPDSKGLEGMRLFAKAMSCNWEKWSSETAHLRQSIMDGKPNSAPLTFLAFSEAPAEELSCARSWGSVSVRTVDRVPSAHRASSHSRIRLGYLSADFRNHPAAQSLSNIVALHDRSRFAVMGLSMGPRDKSEIAERVIDALDSFYDLATKNDAEAAAFIQELEIDILVLNSVWTAFSRHNILAYRPAPIQVNFSGYTSGLDFLDYIAADPRAILPNERQFYSERVAYVRGFANDTTQRISDVRPKRADHGLPEDAFVFACFAACYKINPRIFDRWMNILRRVDGSVLWLMRDAAGVDNLRKEAAARNVDPSRLIFASRVPSTGDHLARIALADLFLDTAPYGGQTTARDALYAGLPVLTRTGKTFVGRSGAIEVEDAGLPELVTSSYEEYENLAVAIANDPERLQKIRTKLRKSKSTARLFDSASYVRDLEAVYEAMYRRHQAGLPPDHIEIAD